MSLNNAFSAYACDPSQSRGRRRAEVAAPTRTEYQRDRDRIVHSTSFRRLVYKTQVFLNHEGDLFRTRLTHSLEVAQLARSIARALGLNEDLVETIALAHDLGHTPFGHAGQDILNECMADYGGFEHNLQSLRVVDTLEERYPDFDGLNLTFETREGILKHCSQTNARTLEEQEPHGVGRRFIDRTQPSLEAQLCNLADEIAYNAHDIDDGVRSGLLCIDQLKDVPLVNGFLQQALHEHPQLADAKNQRRLLYETIRLMLSAQVYAVIHASQEALRAASPTTADAARAMSGLISFDATMRSQSFALKQFLRENLYRHPKVMHTTGQAKQIVRDLFLRYMAKPDAMAANFHAKALAEGEGASGLARTVADYIAGMTDRFAMREHERMTGQRVLPGV